MSLIKQVNKHRLGFIFIFLAHVLLLQGALVTAETQTPDEPTEITADPNWASAQNLTSNTYGSRLAVVRGAPNGRTVILGYVRQMSDVESNTDVYYRRSTSNGSPGSWSAEARIHTSGGVRSTELDLAFDSTNTAHAVWVENGLELHYAKEGDWNSNTSTTLSSSSTGITNPRIIASGTSNLDIVWAEFDTVWQIFHARSKNNGSTWAVAKNLVSVGSTDFSTRPTLTVSGNTVHAVWEEGVVSIQVQYARGTVNTSTNQVTWTTPRTISTVSSATNAKQPQILLSGTTLHVVYTERLAEQSQFIHHIQCSSNCTNSSVNTYWNSTGNPVSGQSLGVYALNPFDLISSIGQRGNCTFVYFHGRLTSGEKEQIWGTNSCSNWAASPKDAVTNGDNRAIYPNLEIHNNWWIYLVYEEFVSTDVRQVRFVRNIPAVHLPLIVK